MSHSVFHALVMASDAQTLHPLSCKKLAKILVVRITRGRSSILLERRANKKRVKRFVIYSLEMPAFTCLGVIFHQVIHAIRFVSDMSNLITLINVRNLMTFAI